jgi:hypothetical protein
VEIRIPDVIAGSDGQPLSIERTLTIDEYSKLVHDLIQRTFGVCDAALSQAGVVTRDLDGVILVGGPTRLPLIRDAVSEYFQQELKSDVDPDEVVAMGAAIHAASLVNPTRDDAFLLDVTPLSLRLGVAGGLAESIIERNTPVPIEQTRRFTTFKDYQESVDIRVYQGESRDVQENELLGQFMFSGFEKARRGEISIDITFEINADGIVDVKAKDLSTGKQASTRITLSAGLSEGEIDNIIQSRRTNRVDSTTNQPTPDGQPADSDEKLAPDVGMLEKPADSDEKLAPEMETLEKPTDSDEKLVRDEGILDEAILDEEMLSGDELNEAMPAVGTPDAATEIVADPLPQLVESAQPKTEPVKSEPALRPIEMDDLITDEIEIPPSLMNDDLLPEPDDLVPEPAELLPESADLLPESAELLPEPDDLVPEPAELLPEPDDLVPESAELLPESDDLVPESAELLPESADLLPESAELLPESDDLVPEPAELLPEPDDLLELEGLEDVHLTPAAIEPAPGGKITAIDEDLTTTTPTAGESEATELEDDLFERPGADLSELDDDETKV